MGRVYVVSNVNHDLNGLRPWGTPVIVNRRYIFSDELDDEHRIPSKFINKFQTIVEDFLPDEDYLVLSGDILQFVTVAVMLTARHGRILALRFDKMAKGYIPVELSSDRIGLVVG